ncbi:MAG: GNAT family N-acetyltransferase [Pirellulales bacterium]
MHTALRNASNRIEPLKKSQIDDVVRIHAECFSNFFLTSFGKPFLRVLYTAILKEKDHIAHVALNNDQEVIGFIAGVSESKKIYKRLLISNFLSFFFTALPKSIVRPASIVRVITVLLNKKDSRCGGEQKQALLMSLAVSKSFSSKGIGQQLVNRFKDDARENECFGIILSTDKIDNERANHFYEKLGFSIIAQPLVGKRQMNQYFLKVADQVYQ